MMIRKIRNILKQSGEWVTGWIKLRKNLQSRFLLSFFIALSAGILFFLLFIFASWNIYEEFSGQEQLRDFNRLKDLGKKIEEDLYNKNERESIGYLKEYETQSVYSFIMVNYKGTILYNKNIEWNDSLNENSGHMLDDGLNYQVPVTLRNGSALIIIRLDNDKAKNMMLIIAIPITLLSIIVFFSIFYYLSRRIIKEVQQIALIVERIKNGDHHARIMLKGEDELSQLGSNINEMASAISDTIEEIKKSELYKRELITGMSHDLKTPLTSLIGYLMLIKDKKDIKNKDQKHYIELSFRKSIQLKKLIEDLFEYSKYSSHSVKLELVNFSMSTFIQQITESYSPQLEEKKIPFESILQSRKIRYTGDPQLLSRAMGNLMDNLLKYSEGDRKSSLELMNCENEIRIIIKNRVISLKMDDMNLLFERMTRGDSSRSNIDGSGLGLAICREIIQLHRGEIHAKMNDDMFEIEIQLPC